MPNNANGSNKLNNQRNSVQKSKFYEIKSGTYFHKNLELFPAGREKFFPSILVRPHLKTPPRERGSLLISREIFMGETPSIFGHGVGGR
jgi:hypothetical protein